VEPRSGDFPIADLKNGGFKPPLLEVYRAIFAVSALMAGMTQDFLDRPIRLHVGSGFFPWTKY
jgi:hypothetical protein